MDVYKLLSYENSLDGWHEQIGSKFVKICSSCLNFNLPFFSMNMASLQSTEAVALWVYED